MNKKVVRAVVIGIATCAMTALAATYDISITHPTGQCNDWYGVGYAWRNARFTLDGDMVRYSMDLSVWKNQGNPITQVFIVIGNTAYKCIHNCVPPTKDGAEFSRISGEFGLKQYATPGARHNIYLAPTLQYTEKDGRNHIETEGMGGRDTIGFLTTSR